MSQKEDEAMTATRAQDVTVSPAPEQAENIATLLSFMEAHEAKRGTVPAAGFFLSGAGEHDRVELNEQLYDVLKQAVEALSRGQSVSLSARDQEITTQQAGEILGISRPTVVHLIESGEIPAHVPGTVRRKLYLSDVLTYRDEIRARRNAFIAESSARYGDADLEDVDALVAEAREAQ
ncbi:MULTISPECIES: excisionase family DNA-binding protein [unclassified Microbacterium]|uniref:excisionase family DNA-binding protein n=1 Tax=unclassified Microbacterium TaxID=2609290 RepID=UPI001FC8C8BC|nr:excisionase family DNA-binding protein [Microbacterium sp. 3H14]